MAHVVFSKILGKKQKGLEVFNLPDKKFCTDSKKLQKMERKELIEQIEHMQKYISNISHKLEEGRKQYQKSTDKIDEATQKLNIVNSKMANISNEHQQLQVKFINLQSSLEQMTHQKQNIFKTQLQFLQSKQLVKQKISDFSGVLKIYRNQTNLVEKIAFQNKQLKQKYTQLQSDFFNLSDKIAQSKFKHTQQLLQFTSPNTNKSARQDTQPDNQQNNQYKLLLQNKQQMIVLLNKKIKQGNDKKTEQEQRICDLNHQIEQKLTQIRQKQQQIVRTQIQSIQIRNKMSSLKQMCQGLQKSLQTSKQQVKQRQKNIQKLNHQLFEVKQKLKCCQQEKKILIGDHSQKILRSQQEQKQSQLHMKKIQYQIQAKNRQLQSLQTKIQTLQQQKRQKQNQISALKVIQKQNQKMKQQISQQNRKNEELMRKIQNIEQNFEIKYKKSEFNANQERIKAQALKRSLTNLQLKQQQNRQLLNQMYEKRMIQDNKFAKMQNKLKEYKSLIQYLKKQKVQLEKTFESKIKNMEEVVVHQVQQQNAKIENNSQPPSDRNERNFTQQNQATIYKLSSKIADLQQQVMFLKQQNKALLNQKSQLQQSNLQLQKSFQVMVNKRQQVMKQINKMNSTNPKATHTSKNKNQERSSWQGETNRDREKRIVQKALKGFDILSKLLTTLYKQFINVHINEINRKQIKEIEGKINVLVGKCEDMKDIFQGYL